MSIRTLRYIGGDTLIGGFHRIGQSADFRMENALWLNHGKEIVDKARVTANNAFRSVTNSFVRLCHVWEYQTGAYGVPVVANTLVAIGSDRAHGFTEYIMADTQKTAVELGTPSQIIAAADRLPMLELEQFKMLDRKEIEPYESDWAIGQAPPLEAYPEKGNLDETWLLTLLSHYWKQASIRAFSPNPPRTVRVCLGQMSSDKQEDIDATIHLAKRFFADVICGMLPRQVQNIASMAAGVDCADGAELYSALEFNITQNLYEEDALQVQRPKELRGYRLSRIETDFISSVAKGQIPASVREFLKNYQSQAHDTQANELTLPFMADYRLWYSLYCIERLLHEGESVLHAARLDIETGINGEQVPIRPARAYFKLMNSLREIIAQHSELHAYTEALLREIEAKLFPLMLQDLRAPGAQPFLLRRSEMVAYQQHLLNSAPESQVDTLISLMSLDQQLANHPQFVRCNPAVPIKSEDADRRNARELATLLRDVMRPLIARELEKEKPEDKYILYLRSKEFAEDWCKLYKHTRKAMEDFLWEEIKEPAKFFLLYGITPVYLQHEQLACTAINYFTSLYCTPETFPASDSRPVRVLIDSCKGELEREDSPVSKALNNYYVACFQHHDSYFLARLQEAIVHPLNVNTTETLVRIFTSDGANNQSMSVEDAKLAFSTFGGKDGTFAKSNRVRTAFTDMLMSQCKKMLADSVSPVEWLHDLLEVAPFSVDTVNMLIVILEDATNSVADPAKVRQMTPAEASKMLRSLGGKNGEKLQNSAVRKAYLAMLDAYSLKLLNQGEMPVSWLGEMIAAAEEQGMQLDTSDCLATVFNYAAEGKRMEVSTATLAFQRLGKAALDLEGKVKTAYIRMLFTQLHQGLRDGNSSVLEWLSNMVAIAASSFRFDTSELMEKIFQWAANPSNPRLKPSDAKQLFDTMANKAAEIDSLLRRNYADMLNNRLQEAVKKKDVSAFIWLCEMVEGVYKPYSLDTKWIEEWHTRAIRLLWDMDVLPVEDMRVVEKWLIAHSVNQTGISCLQQCCERALQRNDNDPAALFERYFTSIDAPNSLLREYAYQKIITNYLQALEKCDLQDFGAFIQQTKGNLERVGYRLDELHSQVSDPTRQYLQRCFENTQHIQVLIQAASNIPISPYRTDWEELLEEKILQQQESMFNRQSSVEKLLALRQEVFANSSLNENLTAAYELIDCYEQYLEELVSVGEYDAIATVGAMILDGIYPRLKRTESVRKTLCACLRKQGEAVVTKAEKLSFRHVTALWTLQASLTENTTKQGNIPDWNYVLGKAFSTVELEKAIQRPYAQENLCVLQRLLALVDTIGLITQTIPKEGWISSLIHRIHSDSTWLKYQTSLAHQQKMADHYALTFDAGKLCFDDNPRLGNQLK